MEDEGGRVVEDEATTVKVKYEWQFFVVGGERVGQEEAEGGVEGRV